MDDLKTFRKNWSSDQKRLRSLLKSGAPLEESLNLFYAQHAVLHNQSMAGTGQWSYADEVFSDLNEDQFRQIPLGAEHSLIWILWHISRIEDITMNILVADKEQIYLQDAWIDKLASPIHYTGNQINQDDLLALSQSIDPNDLQEYREAVGKQTRSIVNEITIGRLSEQVSPTGLERIVKEGAVLVESVELLAYWGKRKIYQLLLMPPTRHLLVHLNEALALRKRIG
jgi:hypothetical protein